MIELSKSQGERLNHLRMIFSRDPSPEKREAAIFIVDLLGGKDTRMERRVEKEVLQEIDKILRE